MPTSSTLIAKAVILPGDEVKPGDLITARDFNQVLYDIADLQRRVLLLEAAVSGQLGPVIDRLSPANEVRAGGLLEIIGSNLPDRPDEYSVDVGGHAVVRYWSSSTTQLLFEVPTTLTGLPRDLLVTVHKGGLSASASIHVLPAQNVPSGSVAVPNLTGDVGDIIVGHDYTFVFRVDSVTNIPERYRLSVVYVDLVGTATLADWQSRTAITMGTSSTPVPQEIQITPGSPIEVRVNLRIPSGATSANMSLRADALTNPTISRSSESIPLVVGEAPPVSDSRTTFRLETLGPAAKARRASIDGQEGYEIGYRQTATIRVSALFTQSGTYAYEMVHESNPGGVWSITGFNPTGTTSETAGSEQEMSVQITLNQDAASGGEKSFLVFQARRTNTDAVGQFTSFVRFPIRGYVSG